MSGCGSICNGWIVPAASQLGMVAAGKTAWATLASIAKAAQDAGTTDAELDHWIRYPHGLDLDAQRTTTTIAAMREHVDPIEPIGFTLDAEEFVLVCTDLTPEQIGLRIVALDGRPLRVTVRNRWHHDLPSRRALVDAALDVIIAGGIT